MHCYIPSTKPSPPGRILLACHIPEPQTTRSTRAAEKIARETLGYPKPTDPKLKPQPPPGERTQQLKLALLVRLGQELHVGTFPLIRTVLSRDSGTPPLLSSLLRTESIRGNIPNYSSCCKPASPAPKKQNSCLQVQKSKARSPTLNPKPEP